MSVDLDALTGVAVCLNDNGINGAAAIVRSGITELRTLRAWKARLGPVEGWFPSLNQGPPGDFANWSWAVMDEARQLLERAKETKE